MMLQIHVLERKEKQREGREGYLAILPETLVICRGKVVAASEVKPDDIIWWKDEPLKVVTVRPWPSEREETNGKT